MCQQLVEVIVLLEYINGILQAFRDLNALIDKVYNGHPVTNVM